ncbi:MAG: hypothetical protein MJ066_01430 [Clostridia bacterium]|nr:hypothetical protein [Clostridia bacterium]
MKKNNLQLANQLINVDEDKQKINGETDASVFGEIARLTNRNVCSVIDECAFFEVKKLMKKMGNVIIRYPKKDSSLEKTLFNCRELNIGETLLSPVYIPACKRQVYKNNLYSEFVGAIIDFPFGESLYKSKVADIKACIKSGVDGITVMLPTMLLEKENIAELKKQVKSIGKLCPVQAGVAISAEELDYDKIKVLFKIIEKSKLQFITFVFGAISKEKLGEKIEIIQKLKDKKQVKVLANVESIEEVLALSDFGIDRVLTPYAEEIGKQVVKRFDIKSVKLH